VCTRGPLPLPGTTLANVPGNPSTQYLTFMPDLSDVGNYVVTYVATDDGVPSASTTVTVLINVSRCDTPARHESWGGVKAIYR